MRMDDEWIIVYLDVFRIYHAHETVDSSQTQDKSVQQMFRCRYEATSLVRKHQKQFRD